MKAQVSRHLWRSAICRAITVPEGWEWTNPAPPSPHFLQNFFLITSCICIGLSGPQRSRTGGKAWLAFSNCHFTAEETADWELALAWAAELPSDGKEILTQLGRVQNSPPLTCAQGGGNTKRSVSHPRAQVAKE